MGQSHDNKLCRSYYLPYDPHHHGTFVATGKIAQPKSKIKYLDVGPQPTTTPYAEGLKCIADLGLELDRDHKPPT